MSRAFDSQSPERDIGSGGDRGCRVLQITVVIVVRSPCERYTFTSI